jgi:hypothetical protein
MKKQCQQADPIVIADTRSEDTRGPDMRCSADIHEGPLLASQGTLSEEHSPEGNKTVSSLLVEKQSACSSIGTASCARPSKVWGRGAMLRGIQVSPGGVRGVWQRYGLLTRHDHLQRRRRPLPNGRSA